MNKFQRAGAGVYGAIENTLDDLRHTWERFVYGRKVTGEVDMFQAPEVSARESPPSTAELFDRLYGKTATRDEGRAAEKEKVPEREPERDHDIER